MNAVIVAVFVLCAIWSIDAAARLKKIDRSIFAVEEKSDRVKRQSPDYYGNGGGQPDYGNNYGNGGQADYYGNGGGQQQNYDYYNNNGGQAQYNSYA